MANRFPIIYLHGYGMTGLDRDEFAADPFCGFNIGSTLYRAVADKQSKPRKIVFESPLVRLATEYQYQHVYQNGADILEPDWQPPLDADGRATQGIPTRSIVIYRYYDEASSYFGDGAPLTISQYAGGLSDLILKVRDLVCQRVPPEGQQLKEEDFRCYLVAHSMGGLVARAFLQNKESGNDAARKAVSKLFTFATPHNGIDLLNVNIPDWLKLSQINTFNRTEMAKFLGAVAIKEQFGRVDLIPEDVFPSDRICCMVGTNRGDYEAAQGLARTFAGHGSDGMVKIDNASVWGFRDGNVTSPAATAYAFRSHAGPFGIVNSEEGYQNLVRFLFGDVRVDIWLDVEGVSLPQSIAGKDEVEALYQVEIDASPRGKRWFLTRRIAVEDSPACRTHSELTTGPEGRRKIYLSSVFLSKRARVGQERKSLAYAMTLAVKVPDYEVRRVFLSNDHYEGADLFRDSAFFDLTPPEEPGTDWQVSYWWASGSKPVTKRSLHFSSPSSSIELLMPFANTGNPGIAGNLRLVVRPWS